MRKEESSSHFSSLFDSCIDKYILDSESLVDNLDLLTTLIENEESRFRLQLNYSQNEILILNTVLTVLSCCIAFGGYLTGAFGMNLDNTNTLQPKQYSFPVVFASTFAVIVVGFFSSLYHFRRSGVLPEIARVKNPRNNYDYY
jgi:Mg2+ and Co2+ transporter CorA